jgi:DNA helicase-2/ATP-dependent DNA helicase PcrA
MTVHAAKGLEFEAVFVTGLEEGLFPAESARFSVKELEEERRLFYVAVTRAKSRCFLSYAKTRFKWGQFQYCTESSFLNDIPKPLFSSHPQSPSLQLTSRADASPARFAPSLKPLQASLQKLTSHPQSSTLDELRVDDRVEHNRFGIGTILSLEGTGPSAKAVVYFQGVGQKTLLLGFAKLKKVNK